MNALIFWSIVIASSSNLVDSNKYSIHFKLAKILQLYLHPIVSEQVVNFMGEFTAVLLKIVCYFTRTTVSRELFGLWEKKLVGF